MIGKTDAVKAVLVFYCYADTTSNADSAKNSEGQGLGGGDY